MAIIKGDQDSFNSLINDEIVLVDFYATWCGPCKMMNPVLEEINNTRSNIKIVKIDVDANEDIAKKYGVMSIPTLILFKNGTQIDKKVGFVPGPLLTEWINEMT